MKLTNKRIRITAKVVLDEPVYVFFGKMVELFYGF
jgi:hypothetical protein